MIKALREALLFEHFIKIDLLLR